MKTTKTLAQQRAEAKEKKLAKGRFRSVLPGLRDRFVPPKPVEKPILHPAQKVNLNTVNFDYVVFLDDVRDPESVWLPPAKNPVIVIRDIRSFNKIVESSTLRGKNVYFALDHYLTESPYPRSTGLDALCAIVFNLESLCDNQPVWTVVRGHSSDSSMNDRKKVSWYGGMQMEGAPL